MKIIILHGPGQSAKRAELLRIKKMYPPENIASVDLKQEDLSQLQKLISCLPLFGTGEMLVIAENTPESLDLGKVDQSAGELTLVLVADKLGVNTVLFKSAAAQKAAIRSFEGEKEITAFPFLDNLLEKRPRSFLELEKLLQQYDGFYVLVMIYYGLRRNLLPLPASNFASRKISSQKRLYQLKDFARLYRLTLTTEFALKSGQVEERSSLACLVQLFIGIKPGRMT